MTKSELLKFLEPFDDEIRLKIDVFPDSGRLQKIIKARYELDGFGNGVIYLQGE